MDAMLGVEKVVDLASSGLSCSWGATSQHNDTQLNGKCAVMLSVVYDEYLKYALYAECRYAERGSWVCSTSFDYSFKFDYIFSHV